MSVLKNIDLDISGYNTVAIIGKSGCGKSTLLRIMSGIESANNGEISINSIKVSKDNLREYQNRISIVFQQHNLFPHLTLLQNITVILDKHRKMPSELSSKKARDLLAQLHLSDEIHKRPRFVSGGQAQRASIARALSTEPDIVFMDEGVVIEQGESSILNNPNSEKLKAFLMQ